MWRGKMKVQPFKEILIETVKMKAMILDFIFIKKPALYNLYYILNFFLRVEFISIPKVGNISIFNPLSTTFFHLLNPFFTFTMFNCIEES